MKKKVYLVWGMYIGDSDSYGSDKLYDVLHMYELLTDYEKAIKLARELEEVERHFYEFYEIADDAFAMLKDGKKPHKVIEEIKELYRNANGFFDSCYVRESAGENYYKFDVYTLSFPIKKVMTNE